ncbi:MAG TPA: hypothetical protein PLL78_07870 [Fimbriimonadaceae bacterium]|nr:hypothetical protein [Fimbriimonadaceae bacterium]HRJ96591.1 hypothetical protein [Fimbriimonadaceae bacterium]
MFRRIALVGLLGLPCSQGLAQSGALGTKKSVMVGAGASGSSGLGGMQLLQMIVAIVIVVALLKWLLPKVLLRMNKRIGPAVGSSIEVEESATFAGGNLLVVRARGKTLLLCVSNQGVSCLADLTEPASLPDPPAFFELLDEAQEKPSATAVVETADIEAALGRLARLEG